MPTITDDRRMLLQIVQEAFDKETWNGTNLKSSLARVPAEVAGWKAPKTENSIARIVLHCAFWKYRLRRSLNGDKRGSFALKGQNWFDAPKPMTEGAWKELLLLLDDEHDQLCDAIANSKRELDFSSTEGRGLVRKIYGVAMHDVYHTGQVQLIRAMHKRAKG
jgi:hypothetical protein